MAAIKNLNGLTADQVSSEIQRGGRFVMYQYTISLIVVTFQRSSDIYFVPFHEKGAGSGLPFTLISFFFGWWGIPWGPIRTVNSIVCNLSGAKDITQEVKGQMEPLQDGKQATRKVA